MPALLQANNLIERAGLAAPDDDRRCDVHRARGEMESFQHRIFPVGRQVASRRRSSCKPRTTPSPGVSRPPGKAAVGRGVRAQKSPSLEDLEARTGPPRKIVTER